MSEFYSKDIVLELVQMGKVVGWLILNVPVNNFSVRRSHRFLGITGTFGE